MECNNNTKRATESVSDKIGGDDQYNMYIGINAGGKGILYYIVRVAHLTRRFSSSCYLATINHISIVSISLLCLILIVLRYYCNKIRVV